MRTLCLGFMLLFAVSCASSGAPARTETNSQPDSVEERRAGAIAKGKELWSRCQFCHGQDGQAQTAYGVEHGVPDITTLAWKRSRKPEEVVASITDGHGPLTVGGTSNMPPQEALSAEEIRALVAYIYSLGG